MPCSTTRLGLWHALQEYRVPAEKTRSAASTANPEDHIDTPTEASAARQSYDADQFERPSVTVDVVILTVRERRLEVLLIKRKHWPYEGMWAIPGGFVNPKESLEDAARRELNEETGVHDVYLEQLYTFGDPDRDPRTRV